MATANIVNDRSYDATGVAKERAAVSALLQSKHDYDRAIRVIISIFIFLIFIEVSIAG